MTTPKHAPVHRLLKISALSIVLLMTNYAFAYSGGTGEPNSPYQIADVNDLSELGGDIDNYEKFFVLTADIDLNPNLPGNQIFNDAVIAPCSSFAFTGSFDGADHKISNLTINAAENANCLGLFGHTDLASGYYRNEIKNLTLENVYITTTNASGNVGGLVGYIYGTPITNCHSTVTINSENNGGDYGGLAGISQYGSISNCSSEGNISITSSIGRTGSLFVGGFLGANSGGAIIDSHSDCNTICDISANSPTLFVCLGGFTGDNENQSFDSTIGNCYSTGTVAAINANVYGLEIGGLVGYNSSSDAKASINKCFSASPVIITGDGHNNVGGLAGVNRNEINDCYSTGPVKGPAPPADSEYGFGGLVGNNSGYSFTAIIRNCYSAGEVNASGGTINVGGLAGYNNATIIASFWDVNTSDLNISAGGTGKTTAQMKMRNTFTDVGWDFVGETINRTADIWRMCKDGVRYPLLYWQFPVADFACPDGVYFIDFVTLANWWHCDNCASNNNCNRTDLDFSGTVDIYDLKIFCDHWLEGL
jgi:hypothetical protein